MYFRFANGFLTLFFNAVLLAFIAITRAVAATCELGSVNEFHKINLRHLYVEFFNIKDAILHAGEKQIY